MDATINGAGTQSMLLMIAPTVIDGESRVAAVVSSQGREPLEVGAN